MKYKKSRSANGQHGTLKERMRYTMHCVENANARDTACDLRHAIYELQTLVNAMPDDWAFDEKTGNKVLRVE